MSTELRKIAYYSIEMAAGDDVFFQPNLFIDLLNAIAALPEADRIIRDERNNKAILLDDVTISKVQSRDLAKIIFRSCKYNHAPKIMSSVDGTERETDKRLFEGDSERTHMCVRIGQDSAYTILEQRQSGVRIGSIIKYLNDTWKNVFAYRSRYKNSYLQYSTIAIDTFTEALRDIGRIMEANVYTTKKLFGSDFLNLENNTTSIQDALVITAKAKRHDSIQHRMITKIYEQISSDTEIKRIRIRGKDHDKLDVILDSLNVAKKKAIVTEIDPSTGTVDTFSIFAKMEELFGIDE